ncbi:hypothetical protein ATCC90586_003106 [Pythium insidiosum]|nr:hypothetical protein ATCC90586_003106 [Pythium insidiosum]
MSTSPASTRATTLIRFLDDNGAVRCGQRVTPTSDRVRLVEGDDPLGSLAFTGQEATIKKLLAPVVPSQILCIGLNYRKHAAETNMPEPKFPVLFTKGVGALQHPHEPIVIPRIAMDPPEVDYECELAVILKEDCKDVSVEDALKFVGGYTCANDVSARRWQGKRGGGQWCRSKGFDTFCPIGPVLVTPEVIPDPQTLGIATYLNGACMQKSSTADMIFSVAELISQLSQDTTLPRGTLILTGTPEGVGFTRNPPVYLAPGDVVEIEIERIGKLVNPVHGAAALVKRPTFKLPTMRPSPRLPPTWALAKQRFLAMISSAAFTRRFIATAALAMYGFSHYPLAEPTSSLSLSLAQGSDSVPLDRRDAFAINVRQVAARIGVKNPENLEIRIGEETNGASVGANATIGRRGACIVLPLELYEAFHATPEMRRRFDIPSKDEVNFVLAHESAHIARNHSMISGTFLPASLLGSCYAIKKIPNKFAASIIGVMALVGGNMLLSWHLEHEADHVAAENGFAVGGIRCFERKLSRNCELRSLLNTRMITEEGNYLGDTSHPFLTSRIHHLRQIAENTTPSSSSAPHSCRYCLKM